MTGQFLYRQCRSWGFDPRRAINHWRGVPYFARNWIRYWRLNREPAFRIRFSELACSSYDRFASAGSARGHYFWQDLWAARHLHQRAIREHVDVASRVDGFVAHILPFCRVVYVDLRPLGTEIEGLEFRQGSLLSLPFADNSIPSLSSLHVLEHVGLGRYGDPVDPRGHLKAAAELSRVLAPWGFLLVGVPVGRERLCFDAHRVFDPQTVVDLFSGLKLEEFSLVDDRGRGVIHQASFDCARAASYGCGLFAFTKER